MKNVTRNKNWKSGTVKVHIKPPPISLININKNDRYNKYFVKNKLFRDPTA